jgi:hypothetical protein
MYSLPMGRGLHFPYYSSMGKIDGGASAASARVEVVMIAQHGAGRNGDDYFCAGCEAARMQVPFVILLTSLLTSLNPIEISGSICSCSHFAHLHGASRLHWPNQRHPLVTPLPSVSSLTRQLSR